MKRLIFPLLVILVVGFTIMGIKTAVTTHEKVQLQNVQLKSTSTKLKTLELRYDLLNGNLDKALKDKNTTQQEIQDLQNQKTDLENQLNQAQQGLQAKANAASALNKVAVSALNTGTVYAASPCGDNQYAQFIYSHESSCHTHNPNAGGCDGIGQACPASKVIDVCGYDYACQNNWFTNYANSRYGGWYQAYIAWNSQYDTNGNHWW